MEKCLAVVTARGGSKRIPRKNIREFMGKPMLAYAVAAALESGLFEEVMVSTDDMEIAEVAKKYGAKVPFMRSAKTASDTALTIDVINEVLEEYKKLGREFEVVCCIYPCVPFLKAETLKSACMAMSGHDAVMPVCEFPVPIEWAMRITDEGLLVPDNRNAQLIRSQDLKPSYYDVGMFYFCKTAAIAEHNSLQPDDLAAYIVSAADCQDIDTEDDWKMAEMKYKMLNGS